MKNLMVGLAGVLAVNLAWACPEGTVKVMVYNTSPNVLLLEAKDEDTCKKHGIAKVKPGIKGKYCIKHDYVLKVTTLSLSGDTRLGITATDLWNDLEIRTPKEKHPDIEFKHVRDDVKLTEPRKTIIKEETLIEDWYKQNILNKNGEASEDGDEMLEVNDEAQEAEGEQAQ